MSQSTGRRFTGAGRLRSAVSMGLAALAAGCGADHHPQTVFDPATSLARSIDDLQALIFWIIMAVLMVVIVALIYILVRFRDRPGAPEPKRVHGNNTLEILWTLGPAILVTIILVPTIRTIFDTYQPGPEGALDVQVIGHQWWWEFRYPELDLVTANQLHIPTDRPVQLTLTSNDVLHNFWVPRLAGKRYAYPLWTGRHSRERQNFNTLVFTVEEPGDYSGQCAEFCGESHALMRFQVVAMEPEAFDEWTERMRVPGIPGASDTVEQAGAAWDAVDQVAVDPASGREGEDRPTVFGDAAESQDRGDAEPASRQADAGPPAATDPLVQEGYEIYSRSPCIACHRIEGVSQGAIGPSLTRFGERWSVAAGVLPNTPENVFRWIRNPQEIKPGARMPGTVVEGGGMPAMNLTDEQVRAIAAYLLSLQ